MAVVSFLFGGFALHLASTASACTPTSCHYAVFKEEQCDARDPKMCLEGQVGLHVKVEGMAHFECTDEPYWQQNFKVHVIDIIRNDVDFMPIEKGMKLTATTGYGEDVGCGFSCSTEDMKDDKEYIIYANAIDPDASPIWPICGNDARLYVGYCFHSMADPTAEEVQLAKDTCLLQSTSKHFKLDSAAARLGILALPSLTAAAAVALMLL